MYDIIPHCEFEGAYAIVPENWIENLAVNEE